MSLGASFLDSYKTAESGSLRAISKLISSGQIASGLVVSQRAAGANMSVDISAGDAFLARAAGDYSYHVFNDAVYNQSITTADPSNPRQDIVVIYRDLSAAGNTSVSNATNGAVKIAIVNGTPASSPVDPTDTAIQSAVGSSNPYAKLARVTVPSSATSITASMITDLRQFISMRADNSLSYVVSGGRITQTTGLTASTSDIVYFLNGVKLTKTNISNRTYTASKDTYVDIDVIGNITYTEVTPGANAPALAINNMRIAIVTTSGSAITFINQGANPLATTTGFDSLFNKIYPRWADRSIARYYSITTTSTGISTSYVPWNGLSNLQFKAIKGRTYRLIVHEPVLDGYAGTSGLVQLRICNDSTSGANTNQVTTLRCAAVNGGNGFDATGEFTALFDGIQYLNISVIMNNITGTMNISRGAGAPATYTIEEC